jgi:hypothetical protein
MKTQNEDDQLLTEMEELYLSSKHWLSDLEFLERNLQFLQKLYGKAFYQLIQQNDSKRITEILKTVSKAHTDHSELKNSVIAYLHTLEPLIKDPEQQFHISIVMVHADLENRIHNLFEDSKLIKKTIADFARWSLKGETMSQALLSAHMNNEPEFKVLTPLFSCMDDGDFTAEELEHFHYIAQNPI